MVTPQLWGILRFGISVPIFFTATQAACGGTLD